MPVGQVSRLAGEAAFAAIRTGIDLCLAGHLSGLVTAPIHKEAFAAAQVPYPGHTEMLADLCGTAAEQVAMMLANDDIRTVLTSIHVPLSRAVTLVTREAVLRTIRHAQQGAQALGIATPKVAVAGLNPHAGEGGLFGDEDAAEILPAIEDARREGIDASGPWPGDTVFMAARSGEFDIVVARRPAGRNSRPARREYPRSPSAPPITNGLRYAAADPAPCIGTDGLPLRDDRERPAPAIGRLRRAAPPPRSPPPPPHRLSCPRAVDPAGPRSSDPSTVSSRNTRLFQPKRTSAPA